MSDVSIFAVSAWSWEGRVQTQHEFTIAAASVDDAMNAVSTRWPELYGVEIRPTPAESQEGEGHE